MLQQGTAGYGELRLQWHYWGLAKVSLWPTVTVSDDFPRNKVLFGIKKPVTVSDCHSNRCHCNQSFLYSLVLVRVGRSLYLPEPSKVSCMCSWHYTESWKLYAPSFDRTVTLSISVLVLLTHIMSRRHNLKVGLYVVWVRPLSAKPSGTSLSTFPSCFRLQLHISCHVFLTAAGQRQGKACLGHGLE